MFRRSIGGGNFQGLHHHIGAGGIICLILVAIFWVAVIVALVLGIRALILHSRRDRSTGQSGTPTLTPPPVGPTSTGTPAGPMTGPTTNSSSLLAILEERYARGEIDRDEFLQRKQDLGLT